jgi:hypothetical protein
MSQDKKTFEEMAVPAQVTLLTLANLRCVLKMGLSNDRMPKSSVRAFLVAASTAQQIAGRPCKKTGCDSPQTCKPCKKRSMTALRTFAE